MREEELATDAPHYESGSLCLEFVNTMDWRTSDHPIEYMNSYADLIAWGQCTQVLNQTAAGSLLAQAAQYPEASQAVLAQAVALRDVLFRLFATVEADEPVAEDDLKGVNQALGQAMSHAQLVTTPEGEFAWGWHGLEEALDGLLWPVLRSAADLLASVDLERVRQCMGEGCGWLFIDTSKNHSRRWCSMESCGNRAKARRHYQRSRKGAQED